MSKPMCSIYSNIENFALKEQLKIYEKQIPMNEIFCILSSKPAGDA